MGMDRMRLALLLALLLLAGLLVTLGCELHEAEHQSQDCPLCGLARAWLQEPCLRLGGLSVLLVLSLGQGRQNSAKRGLCPAETPVSQRVLLLP